MNQKKNYTALEHLMQIYPKLYVECWVKQNSYWNTCINPLNMKRRLLYLKTQSVPHSKHFSSRL